MTVPVPTVDGVEQVPWNEVARQLDWKQGEHLAMIGATGLGKTTLALNLLPLRRFVVAFATKPRDDVMETLQKRSGYRKIKQWQSLSPTMYPRRILWPSARRLDADEHQKEVFRDAFHKIYLEGGWTLFIDELWYIATHLKLEHEVRTYLLQARSLAISLMMAAQRPSRIPVEVYNQSTHLFFFRENDAYNLKRISDIGNLDSELVREQVMRLPRFYVLYINTREGKMMVTKSPKREEVT